MNEILDHLQLVPVSKKTNIIPMICCGKRGGCYRYQLYSAKNIIIKCEYGSPDLKTFQKYLNNCEYYYEFGSGGSTLYASELPNIKKIFSIESDKQWCDHIFQTLKENNKCHVDMKYIELYCKKDSCGHPGRDLNGKLIASYEEIIKYPRSMESFPKEEIDKVDVVLIDGRYRISSCLHAFNHIKDECIIIFDDFKMRKKYHIVLDYYDIIDRNWNDVKDELGDLVVLKKKKNITSIDEETIKKHYSDED
tara:strand:- start:1515 stop:2264 length:750 start_codon:yes stop_codon:yes gene_type:complete